jgi:membrane dipeptidase
MQVEERTVDATEATLALHREAIVFDCLALIYVLEEPYTTRMREGGVTAVNVTITTEDEDWDETLKLTERSLAQIERHPDLVQATSAAEIRAAKAAGKIAVILGTQGANMLGRHVDRLDVLHRLGFRYFGPAYTGASLFADGCGEFRDAGLSVLGHELIERANDLNMIVDLSHCGHRSRFEAAAAAKHPVCTHSNAYTVNNNDRNTKDETIVAIAEKGGVIGICGMPRSVAPKDATLDGMIDHADHIVGIVGRDHVGLGSDFTEAFQDAHASGGEYAGWSFVPKWRRIRPDIFGAYDEFYTTPYPQGFESVRLLPNLTQRLRDRGHSDESTRLLLGENWLRHFERAMGA